MGANFLMLLRDFVFLLWHESWVGSAALQHLLRTAKTEEDIERFWMTNANKMRLKSIDAVLLAAQEVRERYHYYHAHVIFEGEARYPPQLMESRRPPLAIVLRGNADLLSQAQIAIVGSRDIAPAAIEATQLICSAALCLGYIPCSGGALGVDAVAHRQAMQYGAPTVLVTATGVDSQYPKENADIYEYCYERGAVLSLFPLGAKAQRECFPTRNTLIASLSRACVITQCREGSGALYTARASLQLNRPVYVASGLPFHAQYAGGLALLSNKQANILCSSRDLPRLCPKFYPPLWFKTHSPKLAQLSERLGLGDEQESPKPKKQTKTRQNSIPRLAKTKNEAPEQLSFSSMVKSPPLARAFTALEREIVLRLKEGTANLETLLALSHSHDENSATLLALELDGIIELGMDRRYSLVRHVTDLDLAMEAN
ncbi:MAG: DNA-processing protein DprA [Bradymonadales bacterium]